MKLLKIKNSVKTTVKPQNIKRKLQGVTSLGYIIIHSPKKVETTVKRGIASVRVFKTKAALKLAKIHLQLKTKATELHRQYKSGERKQEHSFSMSYAKKEVNDLTKKVETAKKLWA